MDHSSFLWWQCFQHVGTKATSSMCTRDAVRCGGLGWAELTTDNREIKKELPHAGSGVGCIQVVFEKSSEVAHRDQPPCMQGTGERKI